MKSQYFWKACMLAVAIAGIVLLIQFGSPLAGLAGFGMLVLYIKFTDGNTGGWGG